MQLFPLRIFPDKTRFDFMGRRWIGFAVSIALTLLSIGITLTQGLNLGIDFTGGVLMEVRTPQAADLATMRGALEGQGFGEVSLQNFGDPRDVIIRIQTAHGEEQAAVVAKVKTLLASHVSEAIDYRKIDYVGPTVGRELVHDGLLATGLAFAAIMCYLWFRFEWQYGLGGILALLHDATMVVGFFAVTRFEFGLTALAAVLTIVGYSINDSVVIYDRIRENMRKFKKMPVAELLNLSINETLARTVLTASTTLLASLALALWGGEVIKGFSWAMVFGVVVGTYSSIYISAPALIYLHIRDTGTGKQETANAIS
jgi:preprotein translocase SecF subunit